MTTHPPEDVKPSRMGPALFMETFGDIFEHTPQIAEAAFLRGLSAEQDTAKGLHEALVAAMRALPREGQLALIKAHPDLAGRLAQAKQITADSIKEQGSAGLDRLTPDELARFTALNGDYVARFGFPFIMAVKGRNKDEILAAFERRLKNGADAEFEEALRQIELIALLRLKDRLHR